MADDEFPAAGDTRWWRHAGNHHYPACFGRPCVGCDTTYLHYFGCPKKPERYDDELERNRNEVIRRRLNAVHIKARRNVLSEPWQNWVGTERWTCPISESRHRMADVQMLGDFIEQQPRPPMITADNFVRLVSFDRPMNLDAGHPLPRHGSDHNKGRYNTTYCVDFSAPYSYRPKSAGPAVGAAAGPPPGDEIDWSAAVRRMKSQFTDVADHRRNGRNTWQDESGIYANEAAKRKRFVVENPIVAPKESPIIECPPPPKESNDVEFTYEPITGHHTVFNPEGAGPTPKTKTYKNFVTFQDEGCIDPWPKT